MSTRRGVGSWLITGVRVAQGARVVVCTRVAMRGARRREASVGRGVICNNLIRRGRSEKGVRLCSPASMWMYFSCLGVVESCKMLELSERCFLVLELSSLRSALKLWRWGCERRAEEERSCLRRRTKKVSFASFPNGGSGLGRLPDDLVLKRHVGRKEARRVARSWGVFDCCFYAYYPPFHYGMGVSYDIS